MLFQVVMVAWTALRTNTIIQRQVLCRQRWFPGRFLICRSCFLIETTLMIVDNNKKVSLMCSLPSNLWTRRQTFSSSTHHVYESTSW